LYINLISQTSEKLDEILKNLLNLTTLKQNDPKIEEFFFKNIIDDVLKNIETDPEFGESKIILNCQTNSSIKTDKTILKFILHNLIENAVYYKNRNIKENMIKISYQKLPEKNRIIISDNGMGIKKENLNKVFNMFYRGTEISKGSGLGLYTVKSFVEKLHGNIEIRSKFNEGTRVIINLPG
jgi:signal transduction histidine kinase